MRTQNFARIGIALSLALKTSLSLACDCTKFPFVPNPPCEKVCVPQVFSKSSPGSLKSVFGLSDELAGKLTRVGGDKPSWKDYERELTSREIETLNTAVKSLDKDKLAQLKKETSTTAPKETGFRKQFGDMLERDKARVEDVKPTTEREAPR